MQQREWPHAGEGPGGVAVAEEVVEVGVVAVVEGAVEVRYDIEIR